MGYLVERQMRDVVALFKMGSDIDPNVIAR